MVGINHRTMEQYDVGMAEAAEYPQLHVEGLQAIASQVVLVGDLHSDGLPMVDGSGHHAKTAFPQDTSGSLHLQARGLDQPMLHPPELGDLLKVEVAGQGARDRRRRRAAFSLRHRKAIAQGSAEVAPQHPCHRRGSGGLQADADEIPRTRGASARNDQVRNLWRTAEKRHRKTLRQLAVGGLGQGLPEPITVGVRDDVGEGLAEDRPAEEGVYWHRVRQNQQTRIEPNHKVAQALGDHLHAARQCGLLVQLHLLSH
mmetsp:Transcript_92715/g.267729  ORF Transcript_92715/g.267729 Transcript_92715/m.267729 type:complete len:257 (+) Transcript_92715:503-1273(+)